MKERSGESEYLFPGAIAGKPLQEIKQVWSAVCKQANLKSVRLHDLRHTFVSRLAESASISEQTIRSLAGHVSRQMLEHYSHVRSAAKQSAIHFLDNYLMEMGTKMGAIKLPDSAKLHVFVFGHTVEPVYEGPPPPEMSTPEMGFGTGRTYPSREAILARFRLVPEQPVLPYVREHIAAWSVADRGNGEWGWKFDQSLFTKMTPQEPPAAPPAGCRVVILRAQHGMMSPEMADRLRGLCSDRERHQEVR